MRLRLILNKVLGAFMNGKEMAKPTNHLEKRERRVPDKRDMCLTRETCA